MFMRVRDFLAPTRGRILLFIIIFVLVFVYDTAFAPFPGSPVVENLSSQEGAVSFVLYILILPYMLSCLIPAFFGLRKRRFLRLASLREFFYSRPVVHEQRPTKQQTFTFPAGTPVVESKAARRPKASKEKQPLKKTSDARKKPKPKKK
jgi:hypothetical protein